MTYYGAFEALQQLMWKIRSITALKSATIEPVFFFLKKAITALKRDAIGLLENLDLLRQLESAAIGA